MFREYPYLNLQDLNLDYILRKIREMQTELNNFVATNAIKYAKPIDWNITTQYEKNTVVIDANSGIAYLSVQPVPSGVAITNTDYWTVIFDLSMFIDKNAKNLTDHVEGQTNTATFNSAIGDWLIWYDVLYEVIAPINAGDAYVIDSNIKHFTIEDVIKQILTNIDNIVDLLGDSPLETQATTITDAINENFHAIEDLKDLKILKKFESMREGYYTAPLNNIVGQSMIQFGSDFLIVGGPTTYGGNTYFTLDEIDGTFSLVQRHTYYYNLHPNAMFYFNDKIYICDTLSNSLYIIDPVTFVLENIVAVGIPLLGGCHDGNGNAYIGDSLNIYRLNPDNSYALVCNLESIIESEQNVYQSFFVYNDYILRVQNRPNIITVFKMDGSYVGFINVGIGNGFYPYGEIQSLYWDGTEVCMLTTPYVPNESRPYWICYMFKTNINSKVTNDSDYGQQFPSDAALLVDNTGAHIKNPNGTSAYPFQSILDASLVYNYLMTMANSPVTYLNVTGAGYTNDALILSDCIAYIRVSITGKIGVIALYNTRTTVRYIQADKLIVRHGDLTCLGGTIDSLVFEHTAVHFTQDTTVNGSNNAISNTSIDGLVKWNATGSSISNLQLKDHDYELGSSPTIGSTPTIDFDELLEYLIFTNSGLNRVKIRIPCNGSGGVFSTRFNTEIVLNLSSGDLSTLRGGSDVTTYCPLTMYHYGTSKFFNMLIKTTMIGATKKLKLEIASVAYYDGTTVSGNTDYVYVGSYLFDFKY